ncbi:SMC-Scp complex subunit ScpB [Clostridium formicaceticum]|uniref:Segregation and condensation protein B n=1 Tax=Clostridium formicaceticum TaxID=1497 RepID=A0ABM6EYZ3_9CLOT|nr:SMC-Scp complex subunit ScpB [Clostridium formicaceticum]AOY78404.1 SMC-Scp complex subunit ScpB [Clostridium formicaceticum]
MNREEIKCIIEAVLFAWSEPISIKELSRVLSIEGKEIKKILEEMIDAFNFHKRGIQIIKMNDYYQLATRQEYYPYIRKLLEPKENKGLTQAALETLAIIAYKQPITKAEIEGIRGVKCDKALSTLQEKSLIEEQGRLEKIGRPIVYGTTMQFLKTFGLKAIDDLPDISGFKLLAENSEMGGEKDIFSK